MKPAVSVAVLAYNHQDTIGCAIDSIISQHHSFPIEILVNDDCSIDKTRIIIGKYEREYSDLVRAFYHTTNRGLINSYFDLISQCTGKYIMQCAGDDYWLPGKMQEQYDYMESHLDVDMCYGVADVLKDGQIIKSFGSKEGEHFEKLITTSAIPALTLCFRKYAMEQYIKEIKPEERSWILEDLPAELWFCKNRTLRFINQKMGVYRLVSNSVSHSDDIQKQKEYLESVKDVRLFFCDDDFRYRKKIMESYGRELANAYLKIGDISCFRQYNKDGGLKGHVKNAISYFPIGIEWLKNNIV